MCKNTNDRAPTELVWAPHLRWLWLQVDLHLFLARVYADTLNSLPLSRWTINKCKLSVNSLVFISLFLHQQFAECVQSWSTVATTPNGIRGFEFIAVHPSIFFVIVSVAKESWKMASQLMAPNGIQWPQLVSWSPLSRMESMEVLPFGRRRKPFLLTRLRDSDRQPQCWKCERFFPEWIHVLDTGPKVWTCHFCFQFLLTHVLSGSSSLLGFWKRRILLWAERCHAASET